MTDSGNFIAYKTRDKQQGDKKPAFTGKLTLPGSTAERGVSVWLHTSKKTGDIVMSGRLGLDANDQIKEMVGKGEVDPDAAIEIMQNGGKGLKIDPNALILFTNKRKAENEKQPDYFGYVNPGKGEPLVRLSVWSRTDRNGNAFLGGATQREQRQEKGMDDGGEPSVDPEPAPERKKGRAR